MTRASLCLLLIALAPATLHADCGSIPYVPFVRIFEPNQRALIAWNGVEQILILSTDLQASKPTKVLEVIPLPSEPTVRQGDVTVLAKATHLINLKLQPRVAGGSGAAGTFGESDGGGRNRPPPPPAGKITFQEIIGATEVMVTHVESVDGFVRWVEKTLRKRNVARPKIPPALRAVVDEYLRDGCRWFVFNTVSLGTELKTKQALEYRFVSKGLYYPMRITRAESGDTKVRLLVLTRGVLKADRFVGIPKAQIKVLHDPVNVTAEEIKGLHPEACELLGRPKSAKLRIWEIKGKLSSFKQDVIVDPRPFFYLRNEKTRAVSGPFSFREEARIRLGKDDFLLHPGAEGMFLLEHPGRRARYGSFRFAEKEYVRVLGVRYTLLMKKPKPPAK